MPRDEEKAKALWLMSIFKSFEICLPMDAISMPYVPMKCLKEKERILSLHGGTSGTTIVDVQFTRFIETLGDFPFPFVDQRRMSKTTPNWGSNSVVARFSVFTKDTK